MNSSINKNVAHLDEKPSKVSVAPLSLNCENLLKRREHVLLGISPFNSYYCEFRITKLIEWARDNFKNFHIFVPDTLPYYNFLALGYSS